MSESEKTGATHARAREDADAGVARCVDLMTSGQWVTGRSHDVVAREFNVSPATVKSWATNASRIIRLAVEGDLEDIRARMLATLDTVVAGAMVTDLKAAISAIDLQAKLMGMLVQKHELAMTPEQALAKYRELTGKDWEAK